MGWLALSLVLYAGISTIAILVKPPLVFALLPAGAGVAYFILRHSRNKIARWKAETDHLRPYQAIVDVEAEVDRKTREANEKLAMAHREWEFFSEAVKGLRGEAEALQRYVDGYGVHFVIPTHTLIDELAEGYQHTEAGKRLAESRAKWKAVCKEGKAITCHISDKKQADAVKLVFLAAFNGDAEEIIGNVKHDNFGKLKQKLTDARALLNRRGEHLAVEITDAYLQARMDELRWAVIVQELKKRDLEEQRELRERQREEERAQREIRKAQEEALRAAREAQRERADADAREAALRIAIDKAAAEARAAASDAQRAMIAKQMERLSASLADAEAARVAAEARAAEAEASNQRALSMAQQTKRGTVYVISNVGSFGEGVFKIGQTRRLNPQERVDELGDASVPFEFDVHAFVTTDDAPGLEARLHRHFEDQRVNKVNPRREFFRVGIQQIREALGPDLRDTEFTMAAAAREYRESLELEAKARGAG
ncbi:MAG: DUF4041 domain-containing protein [Puniceicoccales bacterium]|jgi:hypothetical protein|nr:DUF4041 domain-containing protein [Puniceicoccales bacterium]